MNLLTMKTQLKRGQINSGVTLTRAIMVSYNSVNGDVNRIDMRLVYEVCNNCFCQLSTSDIIYYLPEQLCLCKFTVQL